MRIPPCRTIMNFNPRSSCEERRTGWASARLTCNFNPRSSCEERLRLPHKYNMRWNFNPRSSCEERLTPCLYHSSGEAISIHAPHARSDMRSASSPQQSTKFQSTLLMRGATKSGTEALRMILFQSTLLMRGATYACRKEKGQHADFNPRSSCEERRTALAT